MALNCDRHSAIDYVIVVAVRDVNAEINSHSLTVMPSFDVHRSGGGMSGRVVVGHGVGVVEIPYYL